MNKNKVVYRPKYQPPYNNHIPKGLCPYYTTLLGISQKGEYYG